MFIPIVLHRTWLWKSRWCLLDLVGLDSARNQPISNGRVEKRLVMILQRFTCPEHFLTVHPRLDVEKKVRRMYVGFYKGLDILTAVFEKKNVSFTRTQTRRNSRVHVVGYPGRATCEKRFCNTASTTVCTKDVNRHAKTMERVIASSDTHAMVYGMDRNKASTRMVAHMAHFASAGGVGHVASGLCRW
jgi:hypothetical protein